MNWKIKGNHLIVDCPECCCHQEGKFDDEDFSLPDECIKCNRVKVEIVPYAPTLGPSPYRAYGTGIDIALIP